MRARRRSTVGSDSRSRPTPSRPSSRPGTPSRGARHRSPGSMRLLAHTDVLDVVPDLYERVARWHVGSISRPAWMWPRILKDASQPTAEPYGKGSFVAVHTDTVRCRRRLRVLRRRLGRDVRQEPDGRRQGARPVGRITRGRTGAVAVPARHRPDHDMEGRAAPGRRTGPPGDARLACVRGGPAIRRPVGPHPRRRRRIDGADLRRSSESVTIGVHDPMFPANTGAWTISAAGAERSDQRADVERRHRHPLGRLSGRGVVARPRVDRCCRRTDRDARATRHAVRRAPHPVLRHRLLTRPTCDEASAPRALISSRVGRAGDGDQGPEKMPSLMSSWRDMYSTFGS